MYAHVVLDRRLQILVDQDRYDRLLAVAQSRGVSVATVVREAIDRGLPAPDDRRRAAAARILDAPGMPVPDVGDLRRELERARSRHA